LDKEKAQQMRIQTFSAVIGTKACDADCPFCVSHITGFDNLDNTPAINFRNFEKAVSLARSGGCTTMLFTGKGEPTLYPMGMGFQVGPIPVDTASVLFVELQTNALQIGYLAREGRLRHHERKTLPKYQRISEMDLVEWWRLGLNTICISVTSLKADENATTYRADYPDLGTTVDYLHELGFSIRLCVMMENGKVDTPEKVFEVAAWCKEHDIAQCTVRPIRRSKPKPVVSEGGKLTVIPEAPATDPFSAYVDEHGLSDEQECNIRSAVDARAELIMTLMHGDNQAKVYDVDGQNMCVSDCLTYEPKTDDIRTLIFYSNGKIMHDWQFAGARLL